MPELVEAARAAAGLANEPLTAFARLPSQDTMYRQEPRLLRLLEQLSGATPAELNEALELLAPAINSPDAYQGNRIAIVCGILVEQGGDPARVSSALLQRLPGQLALAARVLPEEEKDEEDEEDEDGEEGPGEELFAREPEGVKAWKSLRALLLSAMAVFCRDMPARIQARRLSGIVDELPKLVPHFAEAYYLEQLLCFTDDKEVIVLHVPERKGWRVRLKAINTNFHLFTLLQARLIGEPSQGLLPGEPTAPDVLALARGETLNSEEVRELDDFARFHFHTAEALQANGTLSPEPQHWVWGETTPDAIVPLVDGKCVLLLGPMLLGGRGWEAIGSFAAIHPALRSDVELLETLTATQVKDWMSRCQRR